MIFSKNSQTGLLEANLDDGTKLEQRQGDSSNKFKRYVQKKQKELTQTRRAQNKKNRQQTKQQLKQVSIYN